MSAPTPAGAPLPTGEARAVGMNPGRRQLQERAAAIERDRVAHLRDCLTVGFSYAEGHSIKVECECGHSAVLRPAMAFAKDLAGQTWWALLKRGAFPCRKCGKAARKLTIFTKPETILSMVRSSGEP